MAKTLHFGLRLFSITILLLYCFSNNKVAEGFDDTEPPVINCTSVTIQTDEGKNVSTQMWDLPDATDNMMIDSFDSTHQSGDIFPLGNTTVTYTVYDTYGNMAVCEFIVLVIDAEPPVINCNSVTIQTDEGKPTSTREWDLPDATDNVMIEDFSSTHQSGDTFSLGSTPVNYTVYDEAENMAFCEFNVIVVEPPQIWCPPDGMTSTNAGSDTGRATLNPDSATGLSRNSVVLIPMCTSVNVLYGSQSIGGSDLDTHSFKYGVNNIVCTATDTDAPYFNESCSFTVTVEDMENPTADCPTLVELFTDEGSNNNSLVSWREPIFSDNVRIGMVSSTSEVNTTFLVGVHVVTYTASDLAGNSVQCDIYVNITDIEEPNVEDCIANLTVFTEMSLDGTEGSWMEPTFTDNVDGLLNSTRSPMRGTLLTVGLTEVIYNATDSSGNVASCSIIITVEDNEDPSITCPDDIVSGTNMSLNTSVIMWKTVSTMDNDRVEITNSTHSPGEVFQLGNTTVTYTVYDASWNSATCSFIVTVEDDEPPQIGSCANITLMTDAGMAYSSQAWDLPDDYSDNVGVTDTNATHMSGDAFPIGYTSVTFTVYDEAGFSDSCVFGITVEDLEAPELMCVKNIALENDPGTAFQYSNYTAECQDNSVSEPIITSAGIPPDFLYPIGETIITFACIDGSSNTDTCMVTVTVADVEPPTIQCPDSIEVEASSKNIAVAAWPSPTTSDNDIVESVASNIFLGEKLSVGSYLVNFTVLDPSSNMDTCSFNFTVYPFDRQQPMFMICPEDVVVVVEFGESYANVTWGDLVYTDNIGVTDISASHVNGSAFGIGTEIVLYTAMDRSGNVANCSFNVTVQDLQVPSLMICPTDIQNFTDPNTNGTYIEWDPPTVIENHEYTLTSTSKSGDFFYVGDTVVTITVVDGSGQTDSCAFAVNITDNVAPTFTDCPGDMDVPTSPGTATADLIWAVPTATDNVGVVEFNASLSPNIEVGLGIMTTVLYTARDGENLVANCTFTITVIDEEDPVIQMCPKDVTVSTMPGGDSNTVKWHEPTVQDNSGTATLTSTYDPNDEFQIGTWTNTYIAVDEAFNTDFCEFEITVEDNEDPVLINCPDDIEMYTRPWEVVAVEWTLPNATDNSGTVNLQYTHTPGMFNEGTYNAQYTATDPSNNVAKCNFTIIVHSMDTESPMIACPQNINVSADLEGNSTDVSWPGPVVIDNHRVMFLNVSHPNGSEFFIGTWTVEYTAEDPSGNFETCSFNVTVYDDQPPVIYYCPNDTLANTDEGIDAATVMWIEPEVTDNHILIVIQSDKSGSMFTIGTHVVVYTFSDPSLNQVECTFDVVVTDIEKPVLECPEMVYGVTDPGQPFKNVTIHFNVSDNDAISSLSSMNPHEMAYPIGDSQLVINATDASDNEESCTVMIFIEDDEPPVLDCINGTSVDLLPGTKNISVMFLEPDVMDNSLFYNVTSSHQPGDVFSLGVTYVTYEATDAAMNLANCTFTVTVIDVEEPEFVDCPAEVTLILPDGAAVVVPNLVTPNATDNIAVDSVVLVEGSEYNKVSVEQGTYTIVYYANDTSGNYANCTFQLIVQDYENPMLMYCPVDAVNSTEPGLPTRAIFWEEPSVMDNTGPVTLSSTYPAGTDFEIGVTQVIYIALDTTGNSETCSFNVTILDEEKPQIVNCSRDIEVATDPGEDFATVSWPEPLITDNSGNVSVEKSMSASLTTFTVGPATEVRYEARDASDNEAVCAFNVTVIDEELPTFSGCTPVYNGYTEPGSEFGSPSLSISWSDNVGVTSNSSNYPLTGHLFSIGDTTVTVTVSDSAGNSANCSFTVRIEDDEDPVIANCTEDIVANNSLGSAMAYIEWTTPLAMDNSGFVTLTSDRALNGMYPIGETPITYTALDPSYNVAICTFTITVLDVEDPTIQCPASIQDFTDRGTNISIDFPMPTASDNDVYSIELSHEPGSNFSIGTHVVTATVTDLSGNQAECTFQVIIYPTDTEEPIIICPMNITEVADFGLNSTAVTWPAPVYMDNEEIVTFSLSIANGSLFFIGSTQVTYFLADRVGNNASCAFEVVIIDIEAPIFDNCPMDIFVPHGASRIVNWTQIEVSDNSGQLLSVTSNYDSGTEFPFGETVVEYAAVDGSDNEAVCNFTVFVEDAEAPTIMDCPYSEEYFLTALNESSVVATWAEPVISDNSGNFTVDQDYFSGDIYPPGNTEVVIIAADATGNTTICAFNITVTDVFAPIFSFCPEDIDESTDASLSTANISWITAQAIDNLGIASLVSTYQPNSLFPVGHFLVSYTAVDISGLENNGTCSFNITVRDTEAPSVICPASIELNTHPGLNTASHNWTVPSPTDNVEVTIINSTYAPNSNFTIGTSEVVYRVFDEAGNEDSCSFTVSVKDEEVPMYLNCPTNVTANTDPGRDSAEVSWDALVTVDNSGAMVTPISNDRSGDRFRIGSTSITYVTLDPDNNVGYCVFDVIVIDNEVPVFVYCPTNVDAMVLQRGGTTAMVTWTTPTAKDNSKSVDILPMEMLQGEYSLGTHHIMYQASDNSGNTADCSFYVNVYNMTELSIACPPDLIKSADFNSSTTLINWPQPLFNGSLTDNITSSHQNNSFFEVGQVIVTYTIYGADGNNASCDFLVMVTDDEKPIISDCPEDRSLPALPGVDFASSSWLIPKAADNVGVVRFNSSHQSNQTFPSGATTVTYTAVDMAGNQATCSFNVTVFDDQDPEFTFCPTLMVIETDSNGTWVAPTWDTPNATDNSGQVTVTTLYTGSMFPLGTVNETVTYIASDDSNNTATCVIYVTIIDGTPPTIENCPTDVTVYTSPGLSIGQANWTEPQARDNGELVSFDPDRVPGSNFTLGNTTVTYTAVDSRGLAAECSFIVTVVDNEKPKAADCPVDFNGFSTSGMTTTVFWTPPSFSDNVDVMNVTSNYQPYDTFPLGPTQVVYEAVDNAGNVANCTFIVDVQDSGEPEFTFCPGNVTIATNANGTHVIPSWEMPNATDNAGPPTITSNYNGIPLLVDTERLITYTAVDGSGNEATCSFYVIITDGTPPVIMNCPSDLTFPNDPTLASAVVNWTEPIANDNVEVVSFASNISPGQVLGFGTEVVTYVATDGQGLTAVCQFNVTVEDVEPPVLTGCPTALVATTILNQANASVFWPSLSSSDNSNTDQMQSNYQPNDIFPIGKTTVVYIATDDSGNSANCSFLVSVLDFEDPVFTFCPDDLTLNLENVGDRTAVASWPMPTATDNAGPPNITTTYNGQAFDVNTTTMITYIAEDSSGNPADCTFSVTVLDSILPKILPCPASFSLNTSQAMATAEADWTVPEATDDGQVVNFTASHIPPLTLPVGQYVITYTAVDDQDLESVCTFTITVADMEAPVFNDCPTTIVAFLNMGSDMGNPVWMEPTATDNIAVVSSNSTFNPRDSMPAGRNTVVYTALDAAGNRGTCSFQVIVMDLQDPVFTTCPSLLDVATTSNGSFAVLSLVYPNATDNAGPPTITSDYNGQPLALSTSTLITFTATDGNSNTDTCTINVTITDGTPPEMFDCPESFSFPTATNLTTASVSWIAPSATDNSGVLTLTSNIASGSTLGLGSHQVTYVATDAEGLTSICSFNVTVYDGSQPQISGCFSLLEVNATSSVDVDWTPPTATDNVGVTESASSHVPNATFAVGTQTQVEYNFTDAAGNTAVCTFTVVIYNATAPVDYPPAFTSCPSNITEPTEPGRYNATISWVTPVATDRESTPSVMGTSEPNTVFDLGSYVITYTATDSKMQTETCVFSVTVEDREKPVIGDCPLRVDVVLPPSTSMVQATWTEPSVTDNSGMVTLSSTLSSGARFSDDTVVTYTAVDDAGNTDSCNFTVYVEGDKLPTFTQCPNNIVDTTLPGQNYAEVVWVTPTAEDDISTPVIVEQSGYTPGSQFAIGIWRVEYVATDSASQSSMCRFNVTVLDQEVPSVTSCPENIVEVVLNNAPMAVSWSLPTATDNSQLFTIMVNNDNAPGNMYGVGLHTVIYTVEDPSGNQAYCRFNITIENDEPPAFSSCLSNSTVFSDPGRDYATVTFSFPDATDDRSTPSLQASHAPGLFGIGMTTVTYTAYDSAGQTAKCVFVITVLDRGNPIINDCPESQTVNILASANSARVYWTPPTANDSSSFTLSSDKQPGDVFTRGADEVTYTATDDSGNFAECSFFINIESPDITYETDGTLELDEINTSTAPFTVGFIDSSLDTLREDLERLFRQSAISENFVALVLTSSSLGGMSSAVIEFDIFLTGSPPPNDTVISNAFYMSLGPSPNTFDSGNRIVMDTLMLSVSTCQQIPCVNGGACELQGTSYACSCPSEWTGDTCELDVNECDTNPCPSERVCVNTVGSYLCGCRDGFVLIGSTCVSMSTFRGAFAITRIGSSEAIFSQDLADRTSEGFQRMERDITEVLDGIFQGEESFVESRVLDLSSGSIAVEYLLVFESDSSVTEDMVTRQMSDSISTDGEIANSALYIRPSSLTYVNQICPQGYCKNGGTCFMDPETFESTCTCDSPHSGERCEVTSIWSPLVIAMVAVAAVLLLVLIVLFVCCCLFVRNRLNEDPEVRYPVVSHFEHKQPAFKMPRASAQTRRQSAMEPPHNPHGRSVSTSFATHTMHVDPNAGNYRVNDGYAPDYPQSSTFIRPYIATGQEALGHSQMDQQQAMEWDDADYL